MLRAPRGLAGALLALIKRLRGVDWGRTDNGIDPRSSVEDAVHDKVKRNHEEHQSMASPRDFF